MRSQRDVAERDRDQDRWDKKTGAQEMQQSESTTRLQSVLVRCKFLRACCADPRQMLQTGALTVNKLLSLFSFHYCLLKPYMIRTEKAEEKHSYVGFYLGDRCRRITYKPKVELIEYLVFVSSVFGLVNCDDFHGAQWALLPMSNINTNHWHVISLREGSGSEWTFLVCLAWSAPPGATVVPSGCAARSAARPNICARSRTKFTLITVYHVISHSRIASSL